MNDTLQLIQAERDRIKAKRGIQDLHPMLYFAVLAEETGEVAKAVNDWNDSKDTLEHIAEELIQVAAVAADFHDLIQRIIVAKANRAQEQEECDPCWEDAE